MLLKLVDKKVKIVYF